MAENPSLLKKVCQIVGLLGGLMLVPMLFLNPYLFTDYEELVGNYLSIYQSARNILLSGEFPHWSPRLFLGSSFWSLQTSYSIFSPFFLVSLLFPSSLLVSLFWPLLGLKIVLAGVALALYLKETGWFSSHSISVALILYLFSGWTLSFVNHFAMLELLLYVPLLLYGIECLFSRERKRWLVLAMTLMLMSHLSFAILAAPFFFFYWCVRFNGLTGSGELEKNRQLRLFINTLLTTLGLNMVVILPIMMEGNLFRFVVGEIGMLGALFRTFVPSLHSSSSWNPAFLLNHQGVVLFQSALVLLALPQLYRKRSIWVGYGALLLTVVVLQGVAVYQKSGIALVNLNMLSLLLTLFHSVAVAYVFDSRRSLNLRLLKGTVWVGSIGTIILMAVSTFSLGTVQSFRDFDGLQRGLLLLAPYVLLVLGLIGFLTLYQNISKLLGDESPRLRHRSLYVILILERVLFATILLTSRENVSVRLDELVFMQEQDGNKIMAVTNDLRALSSEFHRVINGSQSQPNSPLKLDYDGFSIGNPHFWQAEWMLDRTGSGTEITNPFVTTALGAKYYLTVNSHTQRPGYEFYGRLLDITIYRNQFFATLGMRAEKYVRESDFLALELPHKGYVFLQAVVLPDDSDTLGLAPFDLENLPNYVGDFQYLQAATYRYGLGIDGIVYGGNSFKHDIELDREQLLVYTIPYARGWRAYLNGESVPIQALHQGFFGILVPAGSHQITLAYHAPGLMLGGVISMSMLVLVGGYFYKKREDKKGERHV